MGKTGALTTVDGSSLKRLGRYARFSTDDPSARYVVLSLWIITLIVIYPYFITSTLGAMIFTLLVTFVMVTAIFTITGRSKYSYLALILVVPALITQWAFFVWGTEELRIISNALYLLVLTIVTISIFIEVIKAKSPIPRHIIWGAIAVYLLIGLNFANLYSLIEAITPGSYLYAIDPGTLLGFTDLIYFSFVTLATLGYGDIVPMTAQARSLAVMEAIIGALYLAILISKLVSLSISSKETK